MVGSLALYEVISRALGDPEVVEVDTADVEWNEKWATSLDAQVAGDSEGSRMLAAGEALRTLSHAGRRHVVFVRHAQPSDQTEAKGSRAPVSALSATGLRQAEASAQRLRALFKEVSAVYHAPSVEARATAEILRKSFGGNVTLIESPMLEEGIPIVPSPSPAALTAVPEDELMQSMARAEGAFRTHVWPPSGEESEAISVEVVVAHGNLIRYLVCRALQLHPATWSRLAAYHGAITWLDIDSAGAVTLREFGGVGHLSKELITYQ